MGAVLRGGRSGRKKSLLPPHDQESPITIAPPPYKHQEIPEKGWHLCSHLVGTTRPTENRATWEAYSVHTDRAGRKFRAVQDLPLPLPSPVLQSRLRVNDFVFTRCGEGVGLGMIGSYEDNALKISEKNLRSFGWLW